MSTGKVTQAVDEITAKTPGVLIVAFKQNGGNATAVNISSLLPEHYITKQMFLDNLPQLSSSFRINFPVGQALPLVFSNFQLLYSQTGSVPRIACRKITGGGWLTASITNAATTASNGTYTAQVIVNNQGVYSPNGIGIGGTATFVVAGGVVTSVTKVAGGSLYNVGDTFTCAALPGAVFTVLTSGSFSYQDLTAQATIIVSEITDEIPANISINVDDDGTGHLADNMQIILSN
ncbi:MAG: hypothetical protein JWR05_3545 [Mucilaginibacter sp.]|nr:hypothetical protein [Mucilaginibacter sp.]